ncbi:GDSL-type esterase/lipase family protein [Ruminococcus sp. Marseille-P6503]|uniref:SGNH/GDSL hydrolase family protein n=1 Tax=Ruminococcus sp. Marseille-P6503 TaxID=2364796 RepID=UPI000F533430|nr:GDSL-type esterase/lipase family protein [Ruminococcus sp. Marseille-P6503]
MLKKISCTAAAFFVFLCMQFICFADDGFEDAETNVPPQILFLGDSIASGYGLEGYDSGRENCRSYANILADKYSRELPSECGFSMSNLAVDGQTSGELAKDMLSGKYDDDVKEADCVVISIGGNDMLGIMLETLASARAGNDSSQSIDLKALVQGFSDMSKRIDRSLESFDTNLGETAAYIKSISSAEVIVQTLYDPFESFDLIPAVKELAAEKISRLNEIIVSHSSDNDGGYTVCDVAGAFSGKAKELTRISQLDIHPNASGHETIADCLDQSVRSHKYCYKRAVEASAQTGSEKASAAAGAVIVTAAVFLALAIRMVIVRKRRR